MKKVLAIAAVLMLLTAGALLATDTRVLGLGVPSWMVSDDSVVNLLPAQLNNFSNIMVFEYDGSIVNMNVNLKLGGGTLGIENGPMLNPQMYYQFDNYTLGSGDLPMSKSSLSDLTNSIASNYGGVFWSAWSGQANLTSIDSQTGAIYAFDLSGMKAAAGLMFGTNGNTDTYTVGSDYKNNYNFSQLNVLLGLGMAVNKMPIDLGLNIGLPMGTSWYKTYNGTIVETYQQTKIDSAVTADLFARTAIDSWSFGLGLGYNMANTTAISQYDSTLGGSWTDNAQIADNLNSLKANIGASDSIKLNESFLVLVGAQFMIESSDGKITPKDNITNTKMVSESTMLDLSIPMYAAAELKINDIFSVRGGINKSVWNNYSITRKDKNNTNQVTVNETDSKTISPDPVMSIGLTAAVGGFKLDLLANKDLVLNGPNFVSGNSNNLSTKFAVSYEWK